MFPINYSDVWGHQCPVDESCSFVAWTECTRQLSWESALCWPIFTKLPIINQHHISISYITLTLRFTFSPCNEGTESLSDVKLSFMWSRRFLSSALWWALFSAYISRKIKKKTIIISVKVKKYMAAPTKLH